MIFLKGERQNSERKIPGEILSLPKVWQISWKKKSPKSTKTNKSIAIFIDKCIYTIAKDIPKSMGKCYNYTKAIAKSMGKLYNC